MASPSRKIRIGRDAACDIVLSDRSISRKHADLVVDASGAMEIVDLDSSSGTYLVRSGKEESVSRTMLKAGDLLRFGKVELSLEELNRRVKSLPASDKKSTPLPLAPMPKRSEAVVVATPTIGSGGLGSMTRCSCGAIKKKGSVCPSCGA